MQKRLNQLKVHPSAARYPMLPPDELAELAADIAEHGLHHPIVLDADGVLIDGRNRFRACEIAGVEPSFETYDGDPIAFIHSQNDHRRHMTAGQLAMAVAFDYPEAEKAHRGRKSEQAKLLASKSFSAARLSQARLVFHHSQALAEAVLSGAEKLDAALKQVESEQRKSRSNEAILARLRENAPDLAKLYDEDSLTLSEAEAAWNEREAQAKNQRETIFRAFKQSIEGLAVLAFEPDVAKCISAHPREFASINALGQDYLAERAGHIERGVVVLRAALSQLEFGDADEPTQKR